ncbi:hypothetical protein BH11PAT2_BH11PAT2_01720 [soil metagenome]
MRIAINLTRDHVAGITSTNISLLNHLFRNDHEFVGIELTDSIYMKGPVQFRAFAPEMFDHHILNIHDQPLSKVIKSSKTLEDVRLVYKPVIALIRKVLRETKPDCILLNGTYYMPWLISLAAQQEKIPIVLWYAGILTKEEEHRSKRERAIFTEMERAMIDCAERIIFPSEICRKTVEEIVAKRILTNAVVIPNPIAQTFMEPSVVSHHSLRHIAAVGRYAPIKNFDAFFAVHAYLKKKKWKHHATFVTAVYKGLENKVPKDIELLDSMNTEELKKFFLTQSLIVCPSLFETFGNAPMEAVCLGIPVLVSNTMGCAEVLQQVGLENMVMDFSDLAAVALRIQELAGQHILPMQRNAIHRVLDHRHVGDQIEAVLMETATID